MKCEICNRPLLAFDMKVSYGHAFCPTCDATLDDNQKRGAIIASGNAKREQEYQADKLERQKDELRRNKNKELKHEEHKQEYYRFKQEFGDGEDDGISYEESLENDRIKKENSAEIVRFRNDAIFNTRVSKLSEDEKNQLWLDTLRFVAKCGRMSPGATDRFKISRALYKEFCDRMIDEGLFETTSDPNGKCNYRKINDKYLANTLEGPQLDLKTIASIRKRNKYIKNVAIIFVIAIVLFVAYKKYT